jgi:hypothetical protein
MMFISKENYHPLTKIYEDKNKVRAKPNV